MLETWNNLPWTARGRVFKLVVDVVLSTAVVLMLSIS